MSTKDEAMAVSPNGQQTDVSSRYISLTRNDLIKTKENALFDDINLYDFKISIDAVNKAEKIIFIDGENSKVFKSRPCPK